MSRKMMNNDLFLKSLSEKNENFKKGLLENDKISYQEWDNFLKKYE